VQNRAPNIVSLVAFFLSLIFAIAMSSSVVAEQDHPDTSEYEFISEKEPVYFSGDRFSYNLETGIVTGSGGIVVVQSDSRLRGDAVTINLSEKTAEIEGNVVVTRLEQVIEGDRGTYDFEKGEGIFHDALGHAEPWYVSAHTVERETSGQYTVENGTLTTCDLPHPHYLLRSRSITVVPDERVVARKISLLVGRLPVFYLPYYSQGLGPARPPLDFKTGTQSDLGAYATIGYNLELTEGVSLRPYVSGFTKSGVGGGIGGHLNLFDGDGRGTFDSFYISDLNDDNTDEPRIHQDRGKGDLYYRHELPYDLTALVQVEYITDHDFLKTFDFDEFSDRELPETFFHLERTADHNVVSLTVRERLANYITDVERQPELRVDLLEQRIGDSGLFFSAANYASYLNVESGGPESARNFTEGRLSYPLHLWRWLGLVPYLEGDATYYSKMPVEDDEYRGSWETGVFAQSRFHKVYGSPFKRYSAFRHLFVPTLTYRFRPTPDEEPADLYQFDSIDSIDRMNMFEVELKNYFQARQQDGRSVDLAQYNFTAGMEFDDGEDRLASLENEFLLRLAPNWEFALKGVNDFRDETRSDLVSGVVGYTRPGGFKATTGVIHEDTVLKPYETQIMYSLSKAFGPKWNAGIEQRYDLAQEELSYQELWVWRDLHCWEVMVRVRDRREATSVMFMVNIKAFPLKEIERKKALQPIGGNHPWPTRW